MRKSFVLYFSLLIIILLSTQAACVLSGSDETAEPGYVVVTATPQPPTATPQPVLTIDVAPCPFPEICPEAQSVTLYSDVDIQFDVENHITVPVGQPVYVRLAWVTSTPDILEQNTPYITFSIEIDGVRLDDPEYLTYDEIYGSIHAPDGYAPALTYGVVLSGLKEGETHRVVITRSNSEAINDGLEDYPAGDTTTLIYVITAANIPKR
jgi:hypothetical protein